MKFSNLPDHVGAPDPSDLVAIVDVSDTSEAASGTSKKLTVQEMMAAGVVLTDGAGVHGNLPMSKMAFPFVVSFQMAGPIDVTTGDGIWVCEFPQAEILGVRASVGRVSAPATTPVVIDVLAGPPFTSVFDTTPEPQVNVGQSIGTRIVPDTVSLERGDALTVSVLQTDEAARNLIVSIYMMAYGFPEESFVPVSAATPDGDF